MSQALLLQRLRAAMVWLAALAFLGAAWLVWRTVQHYGWREIVAALRGIGAQEWVVASLCTAGSYLALTASDWIATRSVTTSRVPYPFTALAAFVSIAVGHVVGFGTVSSATIRYRMYASRGVLEGDVVRIVVFSAVTVTLGLTALVGATFLLRSHAVAEFAQLPHAAVLSVGSTALVAVVAYVAWARSRPRERRLFRFRMPVPSAGAAMAQVLIGTVNYVLVAGTLHTLLRDSTDVSLLTFASYYSIGHVLSIVTHVPAGLGVMELVVLTAAPGPGSVGGLIAFRVLYYLVPFAVGSVLYAAFELRQRRRASRGGRPRPSVLVRRSQDSSHVLPTNPDRS